MKLTLSALKEKGVLDERAVTSFAKGQRVRIDTISPTSPPTSPNGDTMKRATVTMPDDLEKAVDSYVRAQRSPAAADGSGTGCLARIP